MWQQKQHSARCFSMYNYGSGSRPRLSHMRTVRRVSSSTWLASRAWICGLPLIIAHRSARPAAVGYVRAKSATLVSSMLWNYPMPNSLTLSSSLWWRAWLLAGACWCRWWRRLRCPPRAGRGQCSPHHWGRGSTLRCRGGAVAFSCGHVGYVVFDRRRRHYVALQIVPPFTGRYARHPHYR